MSSIKYVKKIVLQVVNHNSDLAKEADDFNHQLLCSGYIIELYRNYSRLLKAICRCCQGKTMKY